MKSIKLSEYFNVIKPEYVYLRLIPNNSIRNNATHKLAKTISSLYKNVLQNIRKEEAKALRVLGKEYLLGTKYSFEMTGKAAYYIYIEKKRIEFYFIIPRHHLSLMREKMSDVWTNVTVKEVEAEEVPVLSDDATKYQLVYTKEDALSLESDRKNNDLLNSNLNVIDVLEKGDKAAIYYNFIPTSQFTWRSTYENTMKRIKRNLPVDREKFGAGNVTKSLVSVVADLADTIGEVLGGAKTNKKEGLLETILERMNGGDSVSSSTRKKANASVIDTQIMVASESSDKLRQRNNAMSLAQSFDTIAGDNKLRPKRYRKMFHFEDFRIKGAETNRVGDEEAQNFLSLPGRETLEKYGVIDRIETQETQVPEDLRKGVIRLGTNTFRGQKQEAYLSTDKEYQFLSNIIIGPNRSGKSTLIGNQSYDAIQNGECVIQFDFIGNCELSEEVAALFPPEKVLNISCDKDIQGLGYNETRESKDPFQQYVNAKQQTTQLTTLINSINADDTALSARMNRYLTAAALVVFISGGSIRDVFNVLQQHKERRQFQYRVPDSQRENMKEYIEFINELDDTDKKGFVVGTKLHLVEGIISRLNKLKDNPYMEAMLKKDTKNNIDLVEEMQKNQIINIKMPETMFSTDNEKDVYTTYWITKIWMALQIRKSLFGRDKMTKVNLFIDELYQVENTEKFLTDKLSRLPKFNIKPVISCHYLNQIKHIREELRSANASYMLISGCDKKNFIELKEELYPFEQEDLLNLPRYHSLNLIKSKDGYGRFITKLPKPVQNIHSEQEKKIG